MTNIIYHCNKHPFSPLLLTQDFRGTAGQIAKFLGKPASEAQLAELEQHVSFRSMQNNDKLNYSWYKGFWDFEGTQEGFMRKGK